MTSSRLGPAVAYFLFSIGLITVVDAVCKIYTTELSPIQLVWGYFVGMCLTLVFYFGARRTKLSRLITSQQTALQWIRPLFLVLSISSLFVGLKFLPLAEAVILGFMAPLFITALAHPLLGERVSIHRWIAVVVGLIGVGIVIRPGSGIWHWAAIMPLAGALSFGLFQLSTRRLAKTESTDGMLYYTGVAGLVWSTLLVPFFWAETQPMHWLVFLGTGVLGAVAHLCMIQAFERAQASLLAPFNYSKLLWSILLGYLVFDELPTANTLGGTTLIIAAGLYVVYRESSKDNKAPTHTDGIG
ncbi:MAG: DMT family transporter [Arenicellales bacterium]|nr:DMT family transporter [Arenicellales bacterium]